MIEEIVKIHNNLTVEIKLGFHARNKRKVSTFAVNTWFFVPNSLDINSYTYDKKDFYRDLKSNIRLITPVFLLKDIHSGAGSPMEKLEEAIQRMVSQPTRTRVSEFEHHIKMFQSILKSALREESEHLIANINKEEHKFIANEYKNNLEQIVKKYRGLHRKLLVATIHTDILNYFLFGDEFMSNIIEQHAFRVIESCVNQKKTGKLQNMFREIIAAEAEYRKIKGYLSAKKGASDKNRELVHKLALLKKYVENVLFVTAHKKKDGILKQQVYYSLAAGVSMVFATAIAFSIQLKYGNFTMPFFVALVVSYMLKDRIKELGRYYFAHKLGKNYFDQKTRITLNDNYIGWSKEAMDFVEEDKVPPEIRKLRNRSAILEANNRNNDEKILLYRKLVSLRRENLDKTSQYKTRGLNDIVRFNLQSFTLKMDNPQVPLYYSENHDEIEVVQAEKIYFVNILMQFRNEDQHDYKRYRIIFNREGIKEIEHL
jgi:hypothetical protein